MRDGIDREREGTREESCEGNKRIKTRWGNLETEMKFKKMIE